MNVTTESSEMVLTRLTNKAVEQRIPSIAFIGCLSIIGLIGNIHVLIIFTKSGRKPSTYRVFVKVLSAVDLITCIVHMPFEIVDLMNPYTFYTEVGCKIFRFFNMCLIVSSAFILVLIALERYRRICNPFKRQMSVSLSKWLCVLIIFISCVVAIPMYFFNGHTLVQIEDTGTNITGYMCYIGDQYYGSLLLYLYAGLIFVIFVISSCLLLVTYYSIYKVIFNRNAKQKRTETSSPVKLLKIIYTIPALNHDPNAISNNELSSMEQSDITIFNNLSDSKKKRLKSSTLRTTRTLVSITAIFMIVFTPYFILNFINSLDRKFKGRLSSVELALFQICVRFVFINNVANPFVYGFTDKHFKRELKTFYCKKQ